METNGKRQLSNLLRIIIKIKIWVYLIQSKI